MLQNTSFNCNQQGQNQRSSSNVQGSSGKERRSQNQSQMPHNEQKNEQRSKQKNRRSSRKSQSKNSNNNATQMEQQYQQQGLISNQIIENTQNSNKKIGQSSQSTLQYSIQSSPSSYTSQFPSINEITQLTALKGNSNNYTNNTNFLSSPNENSYQDSPAQNQQQRSVSPVKEERKYDSDDQENNPSLANIQTNNTNNSINSNQNNNNMNMHNNQINQSNASNNNLGISNFINGNSGQSSHLNHIQQHHSHNLQQMCCPLNGSSNLNSMINNNNFDINNTSSCHEKSSSKQRNVNGKGKKYGYKHGQMNLNCDQNSLNGKEQHKTCQKNCQQALCQNNKGLRNLSNLLKSLKFSPLLAQQQQVTQSLMTLPFELHFIICSYLSPKDIYLRLANVNQYFRKICKDIRLWNYIQKFQTLTINDKYQKNIPVVERRSKGRLFSAVSRLDNNQFMIRNVNIMISNAGQDDGVPTSILRELSYLQALDHPNITKIHEVDIKNVIVQIVSKRQEYNLKEYIRRYISQVQDESKGLTRPQYKIPLMKVKEIAFQILEGLNYLHHQGIMHRNLKIDNILLDKDVVKISDFGLSRLVSIPHIPYTPEDPKERERSGREARRLWYRAPELLLRKSIYTFEIDMWSFGCLLAEIVLNEPLFAGDSEIEQLFKVFKFIGSPDSETLMSMCDNPDYQQTFPKWKMINLSHICEQNQSEEFKQLKTTMIPNRQNGFQKLKNLGTVLGMQGMQLLNSLLQLNPYKRISSQEALNHPFFDEIRQQRTLMNIHMQIDETININKCCSQVVPSCYFQFSLPYCHLSTIYQTMVKQEKTETLIKPDYMKNQTFITENMRIILIDWLIDVSVHFEAQDETLHYCISYIDRVMSKMNIERQKLQLIGVSCMKIADVFNERSREYYKQENAIEYAYITAEEYNAAQLIAMEKKILKTLSFQLNTPNMMYFLKIMCTLFDTDSQVSVIAMFLTDLLLMSYEALRFKPSLLASCCIFLSFLTNERELPSQEKLNVVRKLLDHYTIDEFKEATEFVRKFWHYYRSDPNTLNFESVYNKYAVVYGLEARLINAPIIEQSQLSQWIYTK
ncbi:hypothetical protein ABPG74_000896 [Tetrahymena malaccensis]